MSEPLMFDLNDSMGRMAFTALCDSRNGDPLYIGGFEAVPDQTLPGFTVRTEGGRIYFSPLAFANFLVYARERGLKPTTINSN